MNKKNIKNYEDNSVIIERASEDADILLKSRFSTANPNLSLDELNKLIYIEENGETRYTDEAQSVFNDIYDDLFDKYYVIEKERQKLSNFKAKLNALKVNIKSNNKLIAKSTQGASGFDIYAMEKVIIPSMESRLIETGVSLEIPYGYEAQVRSRSGMALKEGLFVLNSPGTIDSDYRGDVGVILYNTSNEPKTIEKNDKVAQIVFAKVEYPILKIVEKLDDTDRGQKGFGSTGKK